MWRFCGSKQICPFCLSSLASLFCSHTALFSKCYRIFSPFSVFSPSPSLLSNRLLLLLILLLLLRFDSSFPSLLFPLDNIFFVQFIFIWTFSHFRFIMSSFFQHLSASADFVFPFQQLYAYCVSSAYMHAAPLHCSLRHVFPYVFLFSAYQSFDLSISQIQLVSNVSSSSSSGKSIGLSPFPSLLSSLCYSPPPSACVSANIDRPICVSPSIHLLIYSVSPLPTCRL